MSDKDILSDAREAFKKVSEAENDNRISAKESMEFGRLGGEYQWPEGVRKLRGTDRPMLTFSRMNSFIRQVVNNSRQNKPSISVHPVDHAADPDTADVISGLIRNIEYASNADIAYDTAVENAAAGGFGYIRVDLEYAHDDSFDLDIVIDRIANPFSVYGDPDATSADGSDWNSAFVISKITKDQFEDKYGGKKKVDWELSDWKEVGPNWLDGEYVTIAEWWTRAEVDRPIALLSDGTIIDKKKLDDRSFLLLPDVTVKRERVVKSWRVKQQFLSGAQLLDDDVAWKGKYIPIVPEYGDEIWIEGKRYTRSLIHDAMGAQQNYNFQRTTATELLALTPKVPWIGPKGAFNSDQNWSTANSESHPYLEYDGSVAPQRFPLDMGPAAGAIQEALSSAEDMKAILGMYGDARRQTVSPESGRALNARRAEEDTSTFHFIDNQRRTIRQVARVVMDLIPFVYDQERVVRVMGEDGAPDMVPLKQPTPVKGPDGEPQMQPAMGPDGQPEMQMGQNGPEPVMVPMTRIYDLAAGKYDLIVKSGQSYGSRREEAALQIGDIIKAVPDIFPIVGDILFDNLDIPGAEKVKKRLEAMVPDKAKGGLPPELQKQMQQAEEKFKAVQEENAQLKAQMAGKAAEVEVKQGELQIKGREAEVDAYRAETERMVALRPPAPPQTNGRIPAQ